MDDDDGDYAADFLPYPGGEHISDQFTGGWNRTDADLDGSDWSYKRLNLPYSALAQHECCGGGGGGKRRRHTTYPNQNGVVPVIDVYVDCSIGEPNHDPRIGIDTTKTIAHIGHENIHTRVEVSGEVTVVRSTPHDADPRGHIIISWKDIFPSLDDFTGKTVDLYISMEDTNPGMQFMHSEVRRISYNEECDPPPVGPPPDPFGNIWPAYRATKHCPHADDGDVGGGGEPGVYFLDLVPEVYYNGQKVEFLYNTPQLENGQWVPQLFDVHIDVSVYGIGTSIPIPAEKADFPLIAEQGKREKNVLLYWTDIFNRMYVPGDPDVVVTITYYQRLTGAFLDPVSYTWSPGSHLPGPLCTGATPDPRNPCNLAPRDLKYTAQCRYDDDGADVRNRWIFEFRGDGNKGKAGFEYLCPACPVEVCGPSRPTDPMPDFSIRFDIHGKPFNDVIGWVDVDQEPFYYEIPWEPFFDENAGPSPEALLHISYRDNNTGYELHLPSQLLQTLSCDKTGVGACTEPEPVFSPGMPGGDPGGLVADPDFDFSAANPDQSRGVVDFGTFANDNAVPVLLEMDVSTPGYGSEADFSVAVGSIEPGGALGPVRVHWCFEGNLDHPDPGAPGPVVVPEAGGDAVDVYVYKQTHVWEYDGASLNHRFRLAEQGEYCDRTVESGWYNYAVPEPAPLVPRCEEPDPIFDPEWPGTRDGSDTLIKESSGMTMSGARPAGTRAFTNLGPIYNVNNVDVRVYIDFEDGWGGGHAWTQEVPRTYMNTSAWEPGFGMYWVTLVYAWRDNEDHPAPYTDLGPNTRWDPIKNGDGLKLTVFRDVHPYEIEGNFIRWKVRIVEQGPLCTRTVTSGDHWRRNPPCSAPLPSLPNRWQERDVAWEVEENHMWNGFKVDAVNELGMEVPFEIRATITDAWNNSFDVLLPNPDGETTIPADYPKFKVIMEFDWGRPESLHPPLYNSGPVGEITKVDLVNYVHPHVFYTFYRPLPFLSTDTKSINVVFTVVEKGSLCNREVRGGSMYYGPPDLFVCQEDPPLLGLPSDRVPSVPATPLGDVPGARSGSLTFRDILMAAPEFALNVPSYLYLDITDPWGYTFSQQIPNRGQIPGNPHDAFGPLSPFLAFDWDDQNVSNVDSGAALALPTEDLGSVVSRLTWYRATPFYDLPVPRSFEITLRAVEAANNCNREFFGRTWYYDDTTPKPDPCQRLVHSILSLPARGELDEDGVYRLTQPVQFVWLVDGTSSTDAEARALAEELNLGMEVYLVHGGIEYPVYEVGSLAYPGEGILSASGTEIHLYDPPGSARGLPLPPVPGASGIITNGEPFSLRTRWIDRGDATKTCASVDWASDPDTYAPYVPPGPPPDPVIVDMTITKLSNDVQGINVYHRMDVYAAIDNDYDTLVWEWIGPNGQPGKPDEEFDPLDTSSPWPDAAAFRGNGDSLTFRRSAKTTTIPLKTYTLQLTAINTSVTPNLTATATADYTPYDEPPVFDPPGQIDAIWWDNDYVQNQKGIDSSLYVVYTNPRRGDDPEQGTNLKSIMWYDVEDPSPWTMIQDAGFTSSDGTDDYGHFQKMLGGEQGQVDNNHAYTPNSQIVCRRDWNITGQHVIHHRISDFGGNKVYGTFVVDFDAAPAIGDP